MLAKFCLWNVISTHLHFSTVTSVPSTIMEWSIDEFDVIEDEFYHNGDDEGAAADYYDPTMEADQRPDYYEEVEDYEDFSDLLGDASNFFIKATDWDKIPFN